MLSTGKSSGLQARNHPLSHMVCQKAASLAGKQVDRESEVHVDLTQFPVMSRLVPDAMAIQQGRGIPCGRMPTKGGCHRPSCRIVSYCCNDLHFWRPANRNRFIGKQFYLDASYGLTAVRHMNWHVHQLSAKGCISV